MLYRYGEGKQKLLGLQTLLETPSLPRTQGTWQRSKNPRQRLCRVPSSAKALPSTALGKEPSEKKINGKEAFCRGPFVGHSAKPFPRANGGAWQRKAAVNGAALLTAPLPSADSYGTRQRHFLFFFQKLFAECHGGKALSKDIFYFF